MGASQAGPSVAVENYTPTQEPKTDDNKGH